MLKSFEILLEMYSTTLQVGASNRESVLVYSMTRNLNTPLPGTG